MKVNTKEHLLDSLLSNTKELLTEHILKYIKVIMLASILRHMKETLQNNMKDPLLLTIHKTT